MLRTNEVILLSFLPCLFHLLAILRSSYAPVSILWALWWTASTLVARVASKHVAVYKRSPAWWETWNARFIFGTTCAAVLTACDVPYAWGACFLLVSHWAAKRVAFVGVVVFAVLAGAGVVRVRAWPALLLVWCVAKQWSEKERCDPCTYWDRRSVVTVLHQELKWFLWCEWTFPHVVRYDVTLFAWSIMVVVVVVRYMTFRGSIVTYRFESMPPDHVPAPTTDAASACAVCKSLLHTNDEERVFDKGGKRAKPAPAHVPARASAPSYVPPARHEVSEGLRPRRNTREAPPLHSYMPPEDTSDPCDFI